jgi:glycosyltransferase
MKLSVVIVAFNAEKTIQFAIESFLAQRQSDKELLIIDGASTDRTLEIARSFPSDQIRIFSEKDRGIYDAMNKGLRLFSGDAVGFLGADDTFHDPDCLSAIATALEDADIAYGDLHMVRNQIEKKVIRVWKSGTFHRRSFATGWMPAHPTFYVRRHVVEGTGAFDLSYDVSSDYDYILRAMSETSYRIQYVPKILVDFQLGGTSTSGLRGIVHQNIECLRSRQRHLNAPFIDAAFFLKWARKLAQFRVG